MARVKRKPKRVTQEELKTVIRCRQDALDGSRFIRDVRERLVNGAVVQRGEIKAEITWRDAPVRWHELVSECCGPEIERMMQDIPRDEVPELRLRYRPYNRRDKCR
jgi:hypothetical protein